MRYTVGDTAHDLCPFCKESRSHEVTIADGDGRIVRLTCDVCGHEHRFSSSPLVSPEPEPKARVVRRGEPRGEEQIAMPLVGERERRFAAMSDEAAVPGVDLEMLLRQVIREELGLTSVVPVEKWRGGELVLRPGKAGVQEKSWPIESFFNKIVMLRNKLRLIETQINAAEGLPDDVRLKLQSYLTGCYGTLTSFNVLFADKADQFRGASGKEE